MASYLHTCYRIGEIDRSVAFYEKLGFEEVARMPIGDEAINVFMGLPGEDPRLELTYNHGVDSYDLGTGYNHIAIAVDDLDGTLEQPRRRGHRAREAPYRPGGRTEGHRICFVRDPDGYRIELIGESRGGPSRGWLGGGSVPPPTAGGGPGLGGRRRGRRSRVRFPEPVPPSLPIRLLLPSPDGSSCPREVSSSFLRRSELRRQRTRRCVRC